MGNCFSDKVVLPKTPDIQYLSISKSIEFYNIKEEPKPYIREPQNSHQHQPTTQNSDLSDNYRGSEFFQNFIIKECCIRCSNIIDSSPISAPCGSKGCNFHFHQQCFEKQMNEVKYKEKFDFKCLCGCKIKSSIIRDSSIENKMELIGIVFTNQVKRILQNHQVLRHDKALQEISNIELKRRKCDFILEDPENEKYQLL